MEKLKIKVIDFFGTIAMKLMIDLDEIIDTIVTVGLTVLVCLIVTNYFFMPVRVSGTSMYPQLHDGSFGFASIIERNVKEIERFDIVVIAKSNSDEHIVKRVIGLPNEQLWYVNDTLYINGQPLEETFLDEEYVKQQLESSFAQYFTNDTGVITLGDDEYFVLGDNRLVSSDSRYYGPFKSEQIVAKGIFIIYPFNLFGKAK